jgi:hypothetical protein
MKKTTCERWPGPRTAEEECEISEVRRRWIQIKRHYIVLAQKQDKPNDGSKGKLRKSNRRKPGRGGAR